METTITIKDRFLGCLLGLAVGDAVGTTLEFKPRDSYKPVTDMIGGGPFRLNPGQWTDDTSMALCLAASLVENQGFDAADQMERYVRWYKEGYLSSTGVCFDIGNTTRTALMHFVSTGDPNSGSTDPYAAGNGCIMRLAPIPMMYAAHLDKAEHYAAESSRTTHGAVECLESSSLFAAMLVRALAGRNKEGILLGAAIQPITSRKIQDIAGGTYLSKTRDQVKGSGYVVACLEAALWCFWGTSSYEECVLMAANLGDDADTTGAVAGQIAGAYYGASGIPPCWLEKLAMRDYITELARSLLFFAQEKGLAQ